MGKAKAVAPKREAAGVDSRFNVKAMQAREAELQKKFGLKAPAHAEVCWFGSSSECVHLGTNRSIWCRLSGRSRCCIQHGVAIRPWHMVHWSITLLRIDMLCPQSEEEEMEDASGGSSAGEGEDSEADEVVVREGDEESDDSYDEDGEEEDGEEEGSEEQGEEGRNGEEDQDGELYSDGEGSQGIYHILWEMFAVYGTAHDHARGLYLMCSYLLRCIIWGGEVDRIFNVSHMTMTSLDNDCFKKSDLYPWKCIGSDSTYSLADEVS